MSDDLTHRQIVERVAALEARFDERMTSLRDALTSLREAIERNADTSAQSRERIIKRIDALERRADITIAVDQAMRTEADKWRGRFYLVLRYVLPPSAAATIAVWLWERAQ
jgi:transposase